MRRSSSQFLAVPAKTPLPSIRIYVNQEIRPSCTCKAWGCINMTMVCSVKTLERFVSMHLLLSRLVSFRFVLSRLVLSRLIYDLNAHLWFDPLS